MAGIEEIRRLLAPYGLSVQEFEEATPTAETAAAAVGCTVAEIAKSILLFVGGTPVLIVTSGDMKVNSSRLKKAAGLSGKVKLPDPEDVFCHTGYEPGGVSPFLLPKELPVYLDRSLKRFERIFPACGNSFSAVSIPFDTLQQITGGVVVDVSLPFE